MPHFAGADAEGKRAKGPVRAGMAVAADNRHARLRQTLFRPDHMDDTLVFRAQVEERDAEISTVLAHEIQLLPGLRVENRDDPLSVARGRRRAVIHRGNRLVRVADLQAALAQHRKCLRRRDFMHQMKVNVQHRRGILGLRTHDVVIPHLLKQGLWPCVIHHVFLNLSQISQIIVGITQITG